MNDNNSKLVIPIPVVLGIIVLFLMIGLSSQSPLKSEIFQWIPPLLVLLSLIIGVFNVYITSFVLLYLIHAVKGTKDIDLQEYFLLILQIYIIAQYFIRLSLRRLNNQGFFLGVEKLFIILILFQPLTLLMASMNHITFIDWGRDLFPYLSFFLILPVSESIDTEKKEKVLRLVLIYGIGISFLKWFEWSVFSIPLLSHLLDWIPLQPSSLMIYVLILLGTSYSVERKLLPLPLGIIILMIFAIMVSAHQRTIWVGLGFGLGLMLILHTRKLRGIVIIAGIFLILFAGLSYVHNKDPELYKANREYFEKIKNTEQDKSWQNRMVETRYAINLIREAPFLGYGMGKTYYFWRPWVVGIGPGYIKTNFLHNDWINICVKTGMVGLALWAAIFISLVITFYRAYRNSTDPEQRIWFLMMTVLVLTVIFVSISTPVLQTRTMAFQLAILISLSLAQIRLNHRSDEMTSTDSAVNMDVKNGNSDPVNS